MPYEKAGLEMSRDMCYRMGDSRTFKHMRSSFIMKKENTELKK